MIFLWTSYFGTVISERVVDPALFNGADGTIAVMWQILPAFFAGLVGRRSNCLMRPLRGLADWAVVAVACRRSGLDQWREALSKGGHLHSESGNVVF